MSVKNQSSSAVSHSAHAAPSGSLLLAGLAVVAAAYFGFVRPAQQHMLSLERQCGKLVIAVNQLQRKDDTARHGLQLMNLLESQGEKLAAAEAALNRFTELRERLVQETDEVAQAITALEQLESVRADVARHSETLSSTANTLHELNNTTDSITTSISASGETARKANGSLVSLSEQQVELANGIANLSTQLSALETAVADRSDNLPKAEQVLAQIDQLFAKLTSEVQNLSTAQTQLSQLAGLKQEVLEQSADVPAAAAVLDQVWDLQEGLKQATSTIGKARQLTVDMMLLEPVLERVTKSLQPMSDATLLSRRKAAKAAPKTRQTASSMDAVSPWSSAINVFVALLSSAE